MNLYLVTNRLNSFYVLADHPTQAQEKLKSLLDEADYGFTKDREVKKIEMLTCSISRGFNGKPFFCSGNLLVL